MRERDAAEIAVARSCSLLVTATLSCHLALTHGDEHLLECWVTSVVVVQLEHDVILALLAHSGAAKHQMSEADFIDV